MTSHHSRAGSSRFWGGAAAIAALAVALGAWLATELALAGDAVALLIHPNDAHFTLLTGAEASARTAAAGQWGACG